MLLRISMFAAVAVVAAVQFPAVFKSLSPETPETVVPQTVAVVAPSGAVTLKADGRGHYGGTFKLNGKPVEGLIDTGASLVAINESTARRLGFSATALDFRYAINTANGKTDAAHVVLSRVEIGGVKVEAVDAFVLRDSALSTTLIGMSFLKKLGSYGVDGDRMTLRR